MKSEQSGRGTTLRALRTEAGVSQSRVAAATGLDPKTIYLLEGGRSASISRKSAEQLARFYSETLSRDILPAELGYHVGRLKKEPSYDQR